jgi:hypothetical protein
MKATAVIAASPMPAHTGDVCIVTGASGLVRSSWRLRLPFTFSAVTWHGFPTATGFPETAMIQMRMEIEKVDCL